MGVRDEGRNKSHLILILEQMFENIEERRDSFSQLSLQIFVNLCPKFAS